jgi:hypothetical protein
MEIKSTNIENLIESFEGFLDHDIYGHINDTSMVYVDHGIYNEYKIVCNDNVYTFEYVCGDRILGHQFLKELKCEVENIDYTKTRYNPITINECKEENFLEAIRLLDNNIFRSNGSEYITNLSNKMSHCLGVGKFSKTYEDNYSYIMYEKIEQYLRFNDHYSKIISLLYLISIITYFDELDEYKHLLKKYTTYTSDKCTRYSNEYIQKISLDILSRFD